MSFFRHRWTQLKIPNNLTLLRIACVPLLLLIFPINHYITDLLSVILFTLAAVTDYFDGFLARKYNKTSKLGNLLDPIADKVLAVAMLLMLCSLGRMLTLLGGLLVIREVAISGLRVAANERNLTVPVSAWGKYKTCALWVGIFCLIIDRSFFHVTGMAAMWIALALSYWSAYQYWTVYNSKTVSNNSEDGEQE